MRRKQKAKQGDRCGRSGRRVRLEVHHVTPRHEGGTNSEKNAIAVSKTEHAFLHRRMAREGRKPKANEWAEKAIVRRMTKEERKEYEMIVKIRG